MLVPALEEDLHVCVRVRLQFCGSRETQGQGRRILEPPVKVPPTLHVAENTCCSAESSPIQLLLKDVGAF